MNAAEFLRNPAYLTQTVGYGLPAVVEGLTRWQQMNNPQLLGLMNNQIGQYNAYAGVPASYAQYVAGQVGNSNSNLSGLLGQQQQLAGNAGIQGYQGPQLSMGNMPDMSGLGQGYTPTPIPNVQSGRDNVQATRDRIQSGIDTMRTHLSNRVHQFLGSFAVGTTNVPQDGMAMLHQGEAVVPAQMNPWGGQRPRPLLNAVRNWQPLGGRVRQALGLPTGNPGQPGNSNAPMPGIQASSMQQGTGASAPSGGAPMMWADNGAGVQTGGPSVPGAAGGGAAPSTGDGAMASGQYFGMSPGLSPEVQQQMINQGTGVIDRQYQALARQMREGAGANGSLNSGMFGGQLMQGQLGRIGDIANLNQNVGIQAAQQNFQDRLAANNWNLGRTQFESEYGRGLTNDAMGYQLAQQQQNNQLMQNLLGMSQYYGQGLGGLLSQYVGATG